MAINIDTVYKTVLLIINKELGKIKVGGGYLKKIRGFNARVFRYQSIDIMDDDRERDRIEQDGILRRYELELKYGVQIQSAEINAAMNTDRELIRQQAAMNQTQVPQQPQPMM